MQTIDMNDLVSASFEACATFAGPADGGPVCAGCGWLDDEHGSQGAAAIATVIALPAPLRGQKRAKRLAS